MEIILTTGDKLTLRNFKSNKATVRDLKQILNFKGLSKILMGDPEDMEMGALIDMVPMLTVKAEDKEGEAIKVTSEYIDGLPLEDGLVLYQKMGEVLSFLSQ